MSKPFALRRKVRRSTLIYEDIEAKVSLLLHNPLTGKPRYGEWDRLINKLLEEHLQNLTRAEKPNE